MALPSLFAVAVSVFSAPRFASYPSFPNGEMASVIPAIHGLKRSNACQGMPACAIAETYLARALSFSFSLSGGPSGSSASAATLPAIRSEEHTSELQSLMRTSYAVFFLKKKTKNKTYKRTKKYNTKQQRKRTK